MFEFLRRLLGKNRRVTPPRQEVAEVTPPTPDDPELRQIVDRIQREALEAVQRERAAEALLTPRERIKKRLNLPGELPADYSADKSVPVLSPVVKDDTVFMVVVINNVGIGLDMPRILFAYLYRQGSLTADDRRVINRCLVQWGLDPESL
jgi:hypothetical protein